MDINEFVEAHKEYLKEFSETDVANEIIDCEYLEWVDHFEEWVDQNKKVD